MVAAREPGRRCPQHLIRRDWTTRHLSAVDACLLGPVLMQTPGKNVAAAVAAACLYGSVPVKTPLLIWFLF